MTAEFEQAPPRLSRSDDAEARALVDSARADVPDARLRSASVARVLGERRQQRARRRRAWARAGVGASLAVAAALALWLQRKAPTETLVARELRPMPSALASGAAFPAPSASALPPELQPCSPAVHATGGSPLIDDFEDNDTRIAPLEHRAGFWSSTSDGTGKQWPPMGGVLQLSRIPGGRGASQFGIHLRGSKFSKWGVLLSADLSARRCYDASAYAGIAFWIRGKGHLEFGPKMTQIAPEEYGGSCTHDCYDGHRITVALSSDWQEVRVPWALLKQKGFGQPVPFDPHSLLSLEFLVLPEQTPYDYWIDDVRFLEH